MEFVKVSQGCKHVNTDMLGYLSLLEYMQLFHYEINTFL